MTLTLTVDAEGYLSITGPVDDPRVFDVLDAAKQLLLEEAGRIPGSVARLPILPETQSKLRH